MSDMSARLEWIEKAALENLKGHVGSADQLAKEAASTLTILLAALSAAFAFALTPSDYRFAAILLTAYLFLLCCVLVGRCMMIGEMPAVTNEPRNLDQEGFDLDALRKAELRNIQQRIDKAARRNNRTARSLNFVRLAAVLSPVAFVLATWVAVLAHPFLRAAAAV